MISVSGVLVGTAALIIVLSVFNGFENLILRLYDSFDPDIRIEATHGKNFPASAVSLEHLRNDPGVQHVMPVIEENALVRYSERQFIVTLKGVDQSFSKYSGIDTMLVDGSCILERGDTDYALIGSGVAYSLQLGLGNYNTPIEIYAPKRDASSLLNPEEAFNRRYVQPSGIFAIQQEYDSRYVLVPFRFAQELFEYDSLVTSIEVTLKKDADTQETLSRLEALIGPDFGVKDRFHQHEQIYRIMKSEKWAVFMILTFILIIATFNIIGTLSMLVIEKKKDIAILHSMGANQQMLRSIFLTEGLFINLIGCIIGIATGFLICLGQQHFGWITLSGSGSFVIDAYPVKMEVLDFVYVFATVFTIGFVAAWYPAHRMVSKSLDLNTVRNDE